MKELEGVWTTGRLPPRLTTDVVNQWQGEVRAAETSAVVTEGAASPAGPWQRTAIRRLHALEQPHPLAAGKAELRGPTQLTE